MINQLALQAPNQDLLFSMRRQRVRFLVIGGQAMRCHGLDRPTTDLDIWLSSSLEDAKKLARVFFRFNASRSLDEWAAAITAPNFRMAYPDDHDKLADLLTSIDGADFEAIYKRRAVGKFAGMGVPVASLDDLILLKQISLTANESEQAKSRDRADIAALEAHKQTA